MFGWQAHLMHYVLCAFKSLGLDTHWDVSRKSRRGRKWKIKSGRNNSHQSNQENHPMRMLHCPLVLK